MAKRVAVGETQPTSQASAKVDRDDQDRCTAWRLRESQKQWSTRPADNVDRTAANARYRFMLECFRTRRKNLCVTTRAGTNDHPFQKHTQVRLRVHYIVIPRLCQSEFFSVSIPSPYGVETGIQASAHSCIRFSSRFRNSRSSSPSDSVRQHGILEIRTFNSSISF